MPTPAEPSMVPCAASPNRLLLLGWLLFAVAVAIGLGLGWLIWG